MPVSDLVKSVIVPLVAAAIAATGIVIPILLFRRQETTRARLLRSVSDRADRERTVNQLRNTVLLLREVVQRFGLEDSLTPAQQQVVTSARDRLFTMLYSDNRLFDYLVPEDNTRPKFVTKLMLTLGELESRLDGSFTPEMAGDAVMLFGIYTLCYLLAVDPVEKVEDLQVLKILASRNSDAGALFEVLHAAPVSKGRRAYYVMEP
ncbi:hypothetical protein BCF44_10714 [Kutzneria buriramensis]|uniref:Uncharacterized protein n=2 Tax=Kutzneria buriramensis TaxID=1045776 RepID=A0A3E0HHM6_9PSEU|nr:hypothetical protein BCF44_10714 [Kutzneria buriramensis]